MNKETIVELVHEGYMDQEVGVYHTFDRFYGRWVAVDLHNETIELRNKINQRIIIDYTMISAIVLTEADE